MQGIQGLGTKMAHLRSHIANGEPIHQSEDPSIECRQRLRSTGNAYPLARIGLLLKLFGYTKKPCPKSNRVLTLFLLSGRIALLYLILNNISHILLLKKNCDNNC